MFWVDFLITEMRFPQYMCLMVPWMMALICETAGQGERNFHLCKVLFISYQHVHMTMNLKKVHTNAMFYPTICINLKLEYLYLLAFFTVLFWHKNPEKFTFTHRIFCFEIVTTRVNKVCSNMRINLSLSRRTKGQGK